MPRIAQGFAGGIGNTGSVCGAVCGGVMAIGLARDRPDSMDGMMRELALAGTFRRRFEAQMGTITCRELTGYDLSTEEGIDAYLGSDAPLRVCFPAVSAAYRIAIDLLDTHDGPA